ncbi:hypothetical protein DL770_003618 [Monosporascus sp. CRB-9-2]|nr:hypothetical protein DL770_003618 [Monosporascus sp. CRB-9-2]
MDHPTDKSLAPASAAAPAPALAPAPGPPLPAPAPANEPAAERRRRPATQADGEFMAEILRHTETKIEIPPAAWPKIAAARGLTVDSAKTRWGQIKRKLGLNATAKPLPEPANRVRKAAAGKGKAAAESSLAAKRAAVGAAEDLNNLQDDTDRSEGEAGPSPAKKLKKEEVVKEEDKDEDEKKTVAVKEEEAEEVKKEEKEVKEEEEEEEKPLVKTEDD